MKGVSIFQAASGEDKAALVPVSNSCAQIVTVKGSRADFFRSGFKPETGIKVQVSDGMLAGARVFPAAPRGETEKGANEKRVF